MKKGRRWRQNRARIKREKLRLRKRGRSDFRRHRVTLKESIIVKVKKILKARNEADKQGLSAQKEDQ